MQTDKDYDRYKDIDLDNTVGIKRINHPLVQHLQDNTKQDSNEQPNQPLDAFDKDILAWVATQDQTTKQYINDMIRHFMNFKTAKTD